MTTSRNLAKEAAAANYLREYLTSLTDDEDVVRDTIEGETNLHEAIAAVISDMREDDILVTGISETVKSLSARKERLENRIAQRRAAIERAMQIGEMKSLTLPEVTISLKAVPPKLEIETETSIPTQYWRTPPPVVDRTALSRALKEGAKIPGARLGNGSVTLQIRKQ